MGALSALMALGLFALDGSAARWPLDEITSPIFDRATIHPSPRHGSGGTFIITTRNNAPDNLYIQSARPWSSFRFPHEVLARGGTLDLELGPELNEGWGLDAP